VSDMSAAGISVSFEFFPPADAAMEATLWSSLERLAPLAPRFVSVTYGADGSTRTKTHDCVQRMLREHDSGRRDNSHWLWSLLMLELWFLQLDAKTATALCCYD